MKKLIDYLKNRFHETSTAEGTTVLAAVLGVFLAPEQTEAIITLAGAIYGAIKVFKKEPSSPDAK